MCLTETWATNDSTPTFIAATPNTHYSINHPRDSHGGGIAAIIRNSIKLLSQSSSNINNIEFTQLQLQLPNLNKPLKLIILYRPPNSKNFTDTLTEILYRFYDLNNVLIIGDFNTDPHSTSFLNILNDLNLTQHISEPTHSKGNILDLIISTKLTNLINHTEIGPQLTDHNLISIYLNLVKVPNKRIAITYRPTKTINPTTYHTDLIKLNISESSNVDDTIRLLFNHLLDTIDKHAPIKTNNIEKRHFTPWWNVDIQKQHRELRKIERIWRKTKSFINRQNYIQQKNKYKKLLLKTKKEFYLKAIDTNKHNTKKLYHIFGKLITKSEPINNTTDIPTKNEFAQFFTDKIKNIYKYIDKNSNDYNRNKYINLLTNSNSNQTSKPIPYVNKIYIEQLLKNIKCNASIDNITTELFKHNKSYFIPIYCLIINQCISSNHFPTFLKHAILTPKIKQPTADSSILNNYRPISNLTLLSKLIERVISKHLTDYLTTHNLTDPRQSAYKRHHSTETILLDITNYIANNTKHYYYVILIMLDLSSAFDTINHSILFAKLESLGINRNIILLIKSYLTNRTFSIINDNTIHKHHDFGVPQGSVLGPLLFSIYISDINTIINKHNFNYHIYADDLQLYTKSNLSQLDSRLTDINNLTSDLETYYNINYLKLNTTKTESIIFHNKNQTHPNITHIKIANTDIPLNKIITNLGVKLDPTLSLNPHISHITKKCNHKLIQIRQIHKFLDKHALQTLISSTILPTLDYCNSIMTQLQKQQHKRLNKILNLSCRTIFKLPRRTHTTEYLNKLHWLKSQKRISSKILSITHNLIYKKTPSYLSLLLSNREQIRTLRSTNTITLNIPDSSNTAFAHDAPVLWNSLPLDTRKITHKKTFKKNMHIFLTT